MPLNLRVPSWVRQRLEEEAARSYRSLSNEVVVRLIASLKTPAGAETPPGADQNPEQGQDHGECTTSDPDPYSS